VRHYAPAPAPAQTVDYTGDVTAIINQLDQTLNTPGPDGGAGDRPP
jgi:hypothetical protein